MDVRDRLLIKLVTFMCIILTSILGYATKELSEIGDNLMKLNTKIALIIQRVEYQERQINEIKTDLKK